MIKPSPSALPCPLPRLRSLGMLSEYLALFCLHIIIVISELIGNGKDCSSFFHIHILYRHYALQPLMFNGAQPKVHHFVKGDEY